MPRKLQGSRAHTFPIWWKSSLGQRLVKEKWNVLSQNQNSETRGFFASLSKLKFYQSAFSFVKVESKGTFPDVQVWGSGVPLGWSLCVLPICRCWGRSLSILLKSKIHTRFEQDVRRCLPASRRPMDDFSQSSFKTILPAAIASRWNRSRKIFWFQHRLQ